MRELFDMICEKEDLDTAKHQLSLPKTGGRKISFDPGTAVGLLKIREIAIIRTASLDKRKESLELEPDPVEDLLKVDCEEVKYANLL